MSRVAPNRLGLPAAHETVRSFAEEGSEEKPRSARRRFEERFAAVRRFVYGALVGRIAFLVYLGLRTVGLFKTLRIGSLNAKGRISIMIAYVEPYLRGLRAAGIRSPWVVVINPGSDPNPQLSRMYARHVFLIGNRTPRLRAILSHAVEAAVRKKSPIAAPWGGPEILKGNAKEWREGDVTLRFTREEESAGESLLQAMEVSPRAPLVCFGLRDRAYYRQFLTSETQRRMNTEAGEDTYIRNPPLKNYVPMALYLAHKGATVLRMGQIAEEALPVGLHRTIIDYVTTCRSPFGDVFLVGRCKFLVTGGAGGLWMMAAAFNRPVVMTDSYSIQVKPLRDGDLFIPKKIWLVSEKRFLSFREMLAAGMRYSYKSNCIQDGVELVHNTPEEITDVAAEMLARLDGGWQPGEEDETLQRRFDALYVPEHYGYGLPGRIGASFLREHRHLLD